MYDLFKDYLPAINLTKKNLMNSDDPMWEKKYSPYIINKCLAPFNDTIMLVNEMNMRHHLDPKLQYDFLLNTIRYRNQFCIVYPDNTIYAWVPSANDICNDDWVIWK